MATNGGTILFNGPLTLYSSNALRTADGGVIDAAAADTDKYIEGNVVSNGGIVSRLEYGQILFDGDDNRVGRYGQYRNAEHDPWEWHWHLERGR